MIRIALAGLLALAMPAAAQAVIEVVFFGGYGSTVEQMRCWQSEGSGSGAHLRGLAYPSGASASARSAVEKGRAVISRLVSEIDLNQQNRYVIAGHSSGSALANAVAAKVRRPDHIELVVLDGFVPSQSLQAKVNSTCWYAENLNLGIESRNAAGMRSCRRHELTESNACRTPWCLHFYVVNRAVPADLTRENFKTHGYRGCRANLEWLIHSRMLTSNP